MKIKSASGATVGALMVITAMLNAADPILPDPGLTPGDIDPTTTVEKVCTPGYSDLVRNVSKEIRRKVFANYHRSMLDMGKYEVDHLISLSLGGSNDIKNLWPQSYDTEWNARIKDKLETRLHRELCNGTITIKEAQDAVAYDWIGTYCALYDDKKEECQKYNNNKEK